MLKVILFLLLLVICTADIVDVSNTGESQAATKDISPLRRVRIENDYENQSISIFWHNPDNHNGVYMFDLEPLETLGVNTMDGHIFYATNKLNENERVSPTSISIRKDLDTYSFGPIIPESYRDRLHPSVKMIGQRSRAVVPKFRCLVPDGADFYADDDGEHDFLGTWPLGREQTMNAYEDQVFFFTAKGDKSKEYARFVLTKDRALYFAYDESNPAPAAMLEHVAKEEAFAEEYLQRTGIMWQHYFGPDGPRPPPVLFMWAADNIGDVHKITTPHGYWNCDGAAADCQSQEPLSLELEVVSTHPKAFIIEDFFNSFEAETIIKYAMPKVEDSTIGQRDGTEQKSDTRTSRNAWVQRQTSSLIDSLYRRAADLLQLDESILYSHKSCESFQVVHYEIGQRYAAHHDWSVAGYSQSRFLTLLLYLTDMPDPEAGGETSFPKAMDGLGFKVMPKKGQAVLFYNMLEDGNADDLSLHAALPVVRGEKWLANLWVWDPSRRP